jgi:uncharacterized membrane protein YfcA
MGLATAAGWPAHPEWLAKFLQLPGTRIDPWSLSRRVGVSEIEWLCGFAFLAGYVDSVVGGGGLIQIPALFILLPNAPPAALFGTNKLSSIAGTAIAVTQYARHVPIQWRATLPTALVAFSASFLGAQAVSSIQPAILRPLILSLLVLIAVYTFIRKDFGALHAPRLTRGAQLLAGIATGAALGFYDGFFGPGTGSFLIFVFVGVFGYSFLAASASSKVVNCATNLSALLYFASTHHVIYAAGLPMAAFNVLGALAGTRLAILRGSRFVRGVFLLMMCAIIVKFARDSFAP